MAAEDFVTPEVGIAVAATAVIASPVVRETVRRGLVYGLAGVLRAGDAVSAAARGAIGEAQPGAARTRSGLQGIVSDARDAAGGGTVT